MREFFRSLAIQRRVLGALIMRETYTRFGRENLGFAWMYGEFLIFAMPVIVMWRVIRGHTEHGLLVVPFVWSGYLPILLFRHIGGRMLYAVRGNIALFYHRNVTPFDAVLSRMAVEIFGNWGAAVFSFFFALCDWGDGLAAQYAIAFSWLFIHDLVVRRGRPHPRRIQRTQRDVRKSLAAGIVYVPAGFGLLLYGRMAAGIAAIDFPGGDAGAAVLRDDPLRDFRPGHPRLLRHPLGSASS